MIKRPVQHFMTEAEVNPSLDRATFELLLPHLKRSLLKDLREALEEKGRIVVGKPTWIEEKCFNPRDGERHILCRRARTVFVGRRRCRSTHLKHHASRMESIPCCPLSRPFTWQPCG